MEGILILDQNEMLLSDIEYIEYSLDEADAEAENPNTKYLKHKEVFEKIKRKGINHGTTN